MASEQHRKATELIDIEPVRAPSDSPLFMSPTRSLRRAFRNAWPWLFFVSLAFWAFWLGWRVLDILLTLFPDLARFRDDLRALPKGWGKGALLPVMVVAYLVWMLLPALVLMFWMDLANRQTHKSFLARFLHASRETASMVGSYALLTVFWGGAVILFAYTSGLLDLLAAIAVLIWILVELGRSSMDHFKRRRRRHDVKTPNTVG